LKCAKKYGVRFDTINPSRQIQGMIPLWHHFGEDPQKSQTNNSAACRCLRRNHNILYVHEATTVLQRTEDNTHRPSPTCDCSACSNDRRTRGCRNPHAYILALERKLSRLLPKWDPRR
ncbi:hypothetical protein C8R44DRAFT_591452, partial [Mycena epipterygia]